jgi:hypothetical protein
MDIPPLKRSIVGLPRHLTFSFARETTDSCAGKANAIAWQGNARGHEPAGASESFRQPWMQKFQFVASR